MIRSLTFCALLMAAAPLASGCGMSPATADGYENAPVSHVHDHWQAGRNSPVPFVLIDVRTPEEFNAGHIAGATLIPLDQLAQRISEVPKDKQVYLYCRSGRRSAEAATLLAKAGYDRVENMSGGINDWQKAGYSVVK